MISNMARVLTCEGFSGVCGAQILAKIYIASHSGQPPRKCMKMYADIYEARCRLVLTWTILTPDLSDSSRLLARNASIASDKVRV